MKTPRIGLAVLPVALLLGLGCAADVAPATDVDGDPEKFRLSEERRLELQTLVDAYNATATLRTDSDLWHHRDWWLEDYSYLEVVMGDHGELQGVDLNEAMQHRKYQRHLDKNQREYGFVVNAILHPSDGSEPFRLLHRTIVLSTDPDHAHGKTILQGPGIARDVHCSAIHFRGNTIHCTERDTGRHLTFE